MVQVLEAMPVNVAKPDPGFATTVQELSVQLKQLHVGDTSLCIVLKGRSYLAGLHLVCAQINEK